MLSAVLLHGPRRSKTGQSRIVHETTRILYLETYFFGKDIDYKLTKGYTDFIEVRVPYVRCGTPFLSYKKFVFYMIKCTVHKDV